MPHTACLAGHKARLDTENTTEHERTIKKCTILHPAPVSISDHQKLPDNLLKLFDTKNLVKITKIIQKRIFFQQFRPHGIMLASKMNIATARLTAATCRRALPILGKARKPITPDKCKFRLKYIKPLPCAAAQFQHLCCSFRGSEVDEVTASPVVQRASASVLFHG